MLLASAKINEGMSPAALVFFDELSSIIIDLAPGFGVAAKRSPISAAAVGAASFAQPRD